jgi:hypothetical protein
VVPARLCDERLRAEWAGTHWKDVLQHSLVLRGRCVTCVKGADNSSLRFDDFSATTERSHARCMWSTLRQKDAARRRQ